MTGETEIVFLGINDAGMRIYEWLCDREGVFVHSLLTTESQLETVREVEPDFVVSCGFRHIVPEEVLEVPSRGCLNVHPAYLPYNRGANPNVWSIVEGTPAGVTIHEMDPGIDTGDIVAQREVETRFDDTGKDLYRRLENAQFDLFVDVWPDIESGEIETRSQRSGGTYHEMADFEELCDVDLHAEFTLKESLDVLRALTFPPHENAIVEVDGQKYNVEVDIQPVDG